MSNIVREDVISVSFDIDLKELNDLQKELNDIKKMLLGGMGDDTFDGMGESAEDATDDIEKLTRENKELRAEIEKLKGQVNHLDNNLTNLGRRGATAAFNGLKKLAGISFKALTVGITAAATAIGGLVAKSVSEYANYEQLVGGVDTLFKDSSGKVQEYAKNAYKTAGLSANEYMETATSFSASLIQSLGGDTKKAADYAHTAITDMSDNANKMGTDMSSLQYAYQGFAKQNYTINYLMSAA